MVRISLSLLMACMAAAAAAVPVAEAEAEAAPKLVKRLRAYPALAYPGDPEFDGTYRAPSTRHSVQAHEEEGRIHIILEPREE